MKKIIMLILIIFTLSSCSDTYDMSKTKVFINGIEIDTWIINDFTLYSENGIFLEFRNKEAILFSDYVILYDDWNGIPKQLSFTVSEKDFQDILGIISRQK